AQGITVSGQLARFETLITHKRTEFGIEIVFTVTDPRSDGTDETSSGVDPSGTLITLIHKKRLICKGILSMVPGVNNDIKCEDPKDHFEEYPKPGFPTTVQSAQAAIEEILRITASIKRLIVSERITVNEQQARFETLISHKRTQSAIEIVFTVMDPRSDSTGETSSGVDPSGTLGTVLYSKKLICTGILSLVPGVKDSIKCEEVKDNYEQIDPFLPSTPSPPWANDPATTVVETAEYVKILRKVERLVFIEKMTVGGYYVRVDKLTKIEKVAAGINIAFTIIPTMCAAKVTVTIDQLYSASCAVRSSSYALICKGVFPLGQTFEHQIRCFFANGTETPLPSQPSDPTDVEVVETAEIAEVTTQIKRTITTKRLTINGQHARLDTLITHKKVSTGIQVEFTITETTCDGSVLVTVEQLYGLSCIRRGGKKLVCKGIITNVPGLEDNIECSERDDVDEFDPSLPSTSSSDVMVDATTVSLEKATISVQRLMLSETMTIKGHHIRVEKLTKVQKVMSGVLVEFSILETTCSGRLRLTLEVIYSQRCSVVQSATVIVCKGLLPVRQGVSHTIRCTGGDKLIEEYPGSSLHPSDSDGQMDKDSIYLLLKKTLFNKSIHLNGWYARLVSLDKIQRSIRNELLVSFTIAPSMCKIERKIKRTITTKRLTINGQHARLDTLITHKKVSTGIQVEFTITETTCDGSVLVTVEQLYGLSCIRRGGKKLVCKGIITNVPGLEDNIECSERDDVDEFDPSLPSTSSSDVMVDATTVSLEKATISVQRLMLSETMTIKGHHIRVEKLTKVQKVMSGVLVEFTISETTCSGRLRLTLEVIYSQRCSVVQSATVIVCKGLLPVRQGVSHTIRCTGGDKLIEEYPGSSLHPSDSDGQMDKDSIYLLLKKTLFNKSIHLNGWYARLVSLDKIQRSIRNELLVSFTIAPSMCKIERKMSLIELYTSSCPVNDRCLWLTCEGILPTASNAEYNFRCSAVVTFNGPQFL
ncbi:hypothetical protein M514_21369, partial [Trichuris suis]